MKLIAICALPRSGTTYLGEFITKFPGFGWLGEEVLDPAVGVTQPAHSALARATGLTSSEYERLRAEPADYLARLIEIDFVDLPWQKQCDHLVFKVFPRHCRQFPEDTWRIIDNPNTFCVYNARNPFDIYLSELKGMHLQKTVDANVWRNFDTTNNVVTIDVARMKHALLRTCMDQEFLWQLLTKSDARHGIVHYTEYESLTPDALAGYLTKRLGSFGFESKFIIKGLRHRGRLKKICRKQDRARYYVDKISNLAEVADALDDLGFSVEGLNWHGKERVSSTHID